MRDYFEIQDFTTKEAIFSAPLKIYKSEIVKTDIEKILNKTLIECSSSNPKPDYIVTARAEDNGITFIRGNIKTKYYTMKN